MTAAAMEIEAGNVENRLVSSSPTNEQLPDATNLSSSSPCSQEEIFSPELLKMYYSRLFPYHLMHAWLSYDPLGKNRQIFSHREFSFTIDSPSGDEIYIRYQSYSSEAELRDAVMKRQPRKIDIGAVFTHPPKDKNAAKNFTTVQRELVFDIDLTDYDDIRNCGCSGANICQKCWKFMTMSVKVMDEGLREDFGFENIAWFYSGRRGVHAWVCDESARALSNEARAAVANYFEVSANKKSGDGVKFPLHPMLERAFDVLEPMFIEHVISESGHGLLANADRWEPFLESMPNEGNEITKLLKKKWAGIDGARTSPEEKWAEINKHISAFFDKGGQGKRLKKTPGDDKDKVVAWTRSMVFKYTYPRLDINVSKHQNHLLKSPFCVHPKTGRVCIPIQVSNIDNFDPFTVPTLAQLMTELDNYEEKDGAVVKDWQKTSLKEPFEAFEKEFLAPMLKDLRRQAREEAEQKSAITGDF